MNRTLKLLYGLGALMLGTLLSISLINAIVSHENIPIVEEATDNSFPNYIEQLNNYYDNYENRKKHFHSAEERYYLPIEEQENCLTCHSIWPHSKDVKTRAFNNQHSRYLTCLVCHIDEKPGRTISFDWYNFGVDNSITRQGPYGILNITESEMSGAHNFISKILPVIVDGSLKTRLYTNYNAPAYFEYRQAVIAGEQVDEALVRQEAEVLISKNARDCISCHSEETDFPWEGLGFIGERQDEMLHSAVVGMVQKYETFYFPSVFE
ncbi:hypothetical protein HQ531_04300 [bacterium]|nr:hypothetical protein [bacterium]